MCGFVGFRNTPEVRSPESVVKAMADRIVHRGPDDADYYVDQDVSLGFRRLSIIDLEGGRQPILNEDGTKVLTFNGEIYNYQEIKKDLLAAGHVFKTATDSEVLLHGYEEYGTQLLNKLRGMFAFVIWDKEKRELFGARDFFGIKPLYYAPDERHAAVWLGDQELPPPPPLCEGAQREGPGELPLLPVLPRAGDLL